MLAKLRTFSLLGIDALPVEVEVDVSPCAMPKTILVGLPEVARVAEVGLSLIARSDCDQSRTESGTRKTIAIRGVLNAVVEWTLVPYSDK